MNAPSKIETIDLTPTFSEAVAICIAVIENTAEQLQEPDLPFKRMRDLRNASENCKTELMRYAQTLDMLKAGKQEAANGS